MDELLEEHVLGGCDGLVLFEKVVDGDGDEVGMGYEMAVILHGVEAMLEGVGGRAGFAGGGARAGGLLCVGAVGSESGVGHGFLAWLVGYVRWIVGNVLFFGLIVIHWISPEEKLAGGASVLIFGLGWFYLESVG